jgi:hypothetical protein
MKIPEVPEIPKHMLGLIVCSVVFTFIAVNYDESLVTYLLKQNVFNAYGFIFAFFAFAMYILTLLFTQNISDDENDASENNEDSDDSENNENSEDSKEIDYSDVPTTPIKIEPPTTKRRLNESDEQIREFVEISSNNDDDSSWVPNGDY